MIRNPAVVGLATILALIPPIAYFYIHKRPILRCTSIFAPLLLFTLSTFVGMWVSYDRALSLPMLLVLLGSVSLFFGIVNSAASPRRIAAGLVTAASVVAFYFVSQYAHFQYQTEVGSLANLGRLTGSLMPNLVFFTPHPNAVATFIGGAFLIGLVQAWQTIGNRRLVWGLAVAFMVYGLLISSSRGAWTGVILAGLIGVMLHFPRRVLQLGLGGVGVIAGGLIGTFAVVRLVPYDQQLYTFIPAIDTASSRFSLYRDSLYLLSDYPYTGIGLGNTFAMVYSRYQLLITVPYLYYAHNLFLSVALGQGLLGLVALIWLLISFYRFIICVEMTGGLHMRSLWLFRSTWLGATAVFVHGLTDSSQFSDDRWTMPMLFALLGLTVAIGRPALPDCRGQVSQIAIKGRYRSAGVLSMVAIITILAAATVIFWQTIVSAAYTNVGAIHQTWADLAPDLDDATRQALTARAVAYFEQALHIYPSQPMANRRLGMIALEQQNFETAAILLERAYRREPANQATLTGLGYAYLWTGELDKAGKVFRQIDDQIRLMHQLKYWQ